MSYIKALISIFIQMNKLNPKLSNSFNSSEKLNKRALIKFKFPPINKSDKCSREFLERQCEKNDCKLIDYNEDEPFWVI